MQRMSLPQMVDAFVWISTCPYPGVGTSNSRNATVLFPGRIAPVIFAIVQHSFLRNLPLALHWLSLL